MQQPTSCLKKQFALRTISVVEKMRKPVGCILTSIFCTILILDTSSLSDTTRDGEYTDTKKELRLCISGGKCDRYRRDDLLRFLTDFDTNLYIRCTSDERITDFEFPIGDLNEMEANYSSVGNISYTVLPSGFYQFVFKLNKVCPGTYECNTTARTFSHITLDIDKMNDTGYSNPTTWDDKTVPRAYAKVVPDLLTNVTATCDGGSKSLNNSFWTLNNSKVDSAFTHCGNDTAIYDGERTGGILKTHICRIQNMKHNNTSWFSLFSRWITTIFDLSIVLMKAHHTEIGDTAVLDCYTSIGTTNVSNISMYWTYPEICLEPHSIIQGELRRIHGIKPTNYTEAMNITLVNVTKSFEGNYTCHVNVLTHEKHISYNLIVHSPSVKFPPTLNKQSTIKNGDITSAESGEPFTLTCEVDSHPATQIMWLKDGASIPLFSNDTHVTLLRDNHTLTISEFTSNDEGNYTCIAGNEYGNMSVYTTVCVNKNGSGYLTWLLIIILIISMCCAAILVCVMVGRHCKKRRESREERERIL